MLQINMKRGCYISFAAWSWMEAKYTFATMVYLVLVLHHGFERLKITFITLLSSVVKQSKGALMCPWTSLLKHFIYIQYGCAKQSKVVYIYSLNNDITASFTLDSYPELTISDLALLV
jgi:hypothetical protein